MGKLKEGMKEIKKEERAEKFFMKYKTEINEGKLDKTQVDKLKNISFDTFKTYIDKMYLQKFGRTFNWNKKNICTHCIINALFGENVSDDEIVDIAGVAKY